MTNNRGFAAIGLIRPKTAANVGAVLRAAACYGAASVMVEGDRSSLRDGVRSATNTTAWHRHMPAVPVQDLRRSIPMGAVPVAVDLVPDAECLFDFQHPQSAVYIFGPEDGTIGKAVLDWCPRRVMVPTRFCMNLAATVNVVLYDRAMKLAAKKQALAA